jgi:hypothetical protein
MPDGFPRVGIWQSRHNLLVLAVFGGFLDPGTSIIQFDLHRGNNQRFRLDEVGGDLFRLQAVHSGQVLTVPSFDSGPGEEVFQTTWNNQRSQRWQLVIP